MTRALCISFRFIHPLPLFHGRGDGDEAEWPPSPMRAFQALLNAACLRARGSSLPGNLQSALKMLEAVRPSIIAPRAALSATGHRTYVPHNHADLVMAAWDRGNNEASVASHRVEKDFRPYRIEHLGSELPGVHYLYPLGTTNDAGGLLDAIRPSARSVHSLGWGIDQVIGDATLVDFPQARSVDELWTPTPGGGRRLRVHRRGSLEALFSRYEKFRGRIARGEWTPVPPLAEIDLVRYRRDVDPVTRPHAIFKLVDENDDTVTYAQARLVHIAGMVRHLAIETMKEHTPRDLRGRNADEWIEAYVSGHQSKADKESGAVHTQLSYIPLQSIGNPNTDPGVRRVMIVAPIGDDDWLEHLAVRLDGMLLKPLSNTTLPPGTRLERIGDNRKDGVRDAYLRPSSEWASVTPVILPGHDDRKPEKTRALIRKALQQSGIEQPCEFEWSAFSQFRKMLSAHKYRKAPNDPAKKSLINYVRPDHLLDRSSVHLTIRFGRHEDPSNSGSRWIPAEVPIPGPIAIGAGRHCGFGLLAASD